MKKSLGQEHAKSGLLSFQGKIGKIPPDFPGKITVIPVLTLLFHLSLPKIWLLTHTKITFLKWKNNRATLLEKFHNVIFKIVDLVATWIIGIFGWNRRFLRKSTSPLRSCYGNQVNTMQKPFTFLRRSKTSLILFKISCSWGQWFCEIAGGPPDPPGKKCGYQKAWKRKG